MTAWSTRPPMTGMPPGLRWVLARAFGPAGTPVDLPIGPDVIGAAARMGLVGRIGGRVSFEVLRAEVGVGRAKDFRRSYQRVAAGVVLHEAVCQQVAEMAQSAGIPIVFLKGMALNIKKLVPIGLRVSSDVDVLALSGQEHVFQGVMLKAGWTSVDTPGSEQHMPPCSHPDWPAVVEIHRILRGLRLGAESSATFEDLQSHSELESAQNFPEGAYVPSEEVLVAHLLVHGLAQHLWHPASYPLLRLVADLVDIGWDTARWDRFMTRGYRWIEADLAVSLVEAIRSLAAELVAGVDPQVLWESDDDPGRLLRHMVLGMTDEAYDRSLRFRTVTGIVPASGSRARSLVRTIYHGFWLSRGQVDQIYGRPKGALGYWGRRLFRPVDASVRAVRYGRDWIQIQMDRRGRSVRKR